MNISFFVGNLVRDPELRKVGGNQVSLVSFTLAVDREFVKKNSEGKKEVDYLDFEVWDKSADNFASRFKKGNRIFVKAEARKDVWEDAEQKKRSRVVFRVQTFHGIAGPGFPLSPSPAPPSEAVTNNDEDIPF